MRPFAFLVVLGAAMLPAGVAAQVDTIVDSRRAAPFELDRRREWSFGAAGPVWRVAERDSLRALIERAEQYWAAAEPGDYEFVVRFQCGLCDTPSPVRVRRLGGRSFVAGGKASAPDQLELAAAYPQRAFRQIGEALDRDEAKLLLVVDRQTRVPILVSTDPGRGVTDQWMVTRLTDLAVRR